MWVVWPVVGRRGGRTEVHKYGQGGIVQSHVIPRLESRKERERERERERESDMATKLRLK